MAKLTSLEGSLPNRLFSLLCDKTIRRGELYLVDPVKTTYLDQLEFFTRGNFPIEFVFLGFPFKCHNPIETFRRTPDLGEIAFLLRLLDIDVTVRQLYPPGVSFTILTEGNAYKDFFGATSEEVQKFEDRLQHFTSNIGMKEKIAFVDFSSICGQFSEFEKTRVEEEKNLRTHRLEEAIHKEIKSFMPVMMRSVPIVEKVSLDDLIAVYDYSLPSQCLSKLQKELRMRLLKEAEELAIRYLAFQRAKNKLKIIPKFFPHKLYVSTTSKLGRYSFHPIHRRTRFFPHHGVPILGSDKVDIVFFREIIKNPKTYTAVYCVDDIEGAPFYFLKGKQHFKSVKIERR